MRDLIQVWHTDHVNFARLLNLLEAQVEPLSTGESSDYELMLDIMYYMTHYPDVVHHPMEDRVFARLAQRDIGARARVELLSQQHAKLKAVGESLVRDLDDIVNGSIASRERIGALARRYLADFREHMNIEESEVMPLAARSLTAEEWAALDDALFHVQDPMFGEKQEKRYAALREQLLRNDEK